jgi:asparagine synthase (glutamine-hydrolysing)
VSGPGFGDFLVLLRPVGAAGGPDLGAALPGGIVREVAPGLSVVSGGDVVLSHQGTRGGVGVYGLGGHGTTPADLHAALVAGIPDVGRLGVTGGFGLVAWDLAARKLWAASDIFRTQSLHWTLSSEGLAVATDLRLLLRSGLAARAVKPAALYHFLNFGYVPSPLTIVEGVQKLPPASLLEATLAAQAVTSYWEPSYPEDLRESEASLAPALKDRIESVVSRYRPNGGVSWGTFLSGGTDSSSIAGILARTKRPVRSFSIGFDEGGYDELEYARIAAAHFSLEARTARVSAKEALELLPKVIEAFDEPFGNSSAIPTHACAAMARAEGCEVLVAGDGGDEIFGGNERYRKDRIYSLYHGAPGLLRGAARIGVASLGALRTRGANRLRNLVRRGSLRNPDRFFTDDSFAHDHFDALLSGDLKGRVRRDDSLDLVRRHYERSEGKSELHRLMSLDLRMAIADCDIVKVTRASRAAGVKVLYPYLDREIIDFTGRLPVKWKLRGLEKRYLFKRAMGDILPREILEKRKHGFGLPISVWFRTQEPYRELLRDTLLSKSALERGYFDPGFVKGVLDEHDRGAWDHGGTLFQLMALELWHRAEIDRVSP